MTKKDYIIIAHAIQEADTYFSLPTLTDKEKISIIDYRQLLLNSLYPLLKKDNPRFDWARFREFIGYPLAT